MNLAKALIKYGDTGFSDLPEILKQDGFHVAHASNYSIKEIRKAITDGYPSFMKLGEKSVMIVGESPGSLIGRGSDGELLDMKDEQLQRFYKGDAVIVIDKDEKQAIPETKDMVIFDADRDNWQDYNRKEMSKEKILRINTLESCELPPYPVICLFREPGEKEAKEGIRAKMDGVNITIFDPSDPVAEFFHELGHIYWMNRLSKEEKSEFKKLKNQVHAQIPIFNDPHSMANEEEIFCTIYLWYLKGRLINPAYMKVLSTQFKPGLEAINDVFSRIRIAEERLKRWHDSEEGIHRWQNKLMGKAQLIVMPNTGKMMKAENLPVKQPGPVELPPRDSP